MTARRINHGEAEDGDDVDFVEVGRGGGFGEERADEEKSATSQSMRSYRPSGVFLVRIAGNAGGAVNFFPPNMPCALSAVSLRFGRMILQFARRRFQRSTERWSSGLT